MRSGSFGRMDAEESVELVSRLRVIEDQPLDARAGAYGRLYEELQSRLEGSDPS